MGPWWTGFLVGIAAGSVAAILFSITLLRKWMVSSNVDSNMIEALIARLAKADRQVKTYKQALEQSLDEADELRSEKLRKWDIPDELP